jgi:outer membrane protein, heavy metal efflux system
MIKYRRNCKYFADDGIAENLTTILPTYGQGLSFYTDETVVQTGSAAMKKTFPTSTKAAMGAGLPKMPRYGTRDAYLQETRQRR